MTIIIKIFLLDNTDSRMKISNALFSKPLVFNLHPHADYFLVHAIQSSSKVL